MAKRLILSVSVWAIHRDLGQICDAMVVALLEDARAHLTRMSNGRGWADSSPRRLGTSGPYHVVDRWIETETNIEGRQAQDAWGVEKMAVGYAAVKTVSVISTGSAAMHREHMYGTRKPALWWVARGKEWIADIPLNVFVIEHEHGLVLFDTGMDPAATTDPDYWTVRGDWADSVVRWFLDRVFRFEIGPDDSLGSQLVKAGYNPEDVKAAVLSHLHFDHVGGIGDIPGAELFVSPDAWDVVQKAKHPERDYVPRSRILVPGARWQLFDVAT